MAGSEHVDDALAPVIPLFAGAPESPPTIDTADAETVASAEVRSRAEKALLKRLVSRPLSVSEARDFLAAREVGSADVDGIMESLLDYGYLDDAALAEQLVHVGVERRSQGRRVIAQTLARRGIPREVAAAALGALPDDDAERALETARAKARSMSGLDRQVALRRLLGQLGRRGFGGSTAMSAAQQALDEL
ncbi:regulatory protein RecX [Microbacterium awajiense]